MAAARFAAPMPLLKAARCRGVLALPRRVASVFAREDVVEAALLSKPWPAWLQREMRSNWAGEMGAVAIYRGCQAALHRVHCPQSRAALAAFAAEHVASEEAHLRAMAALVQEPAERSWLPAFTLGWLLGYVSTAARGARGMYVTTHAVESFVEEHYGEQIARLEHELSAEPGHAYHELLKLLRAACADEVHHKEDAMARAAASDGSVAGDRLHFTLVYWGSRAGAALARRI